LIHLLARKTGLLKEIDKNLELLKRHLPYHESDHVANMAYNILAGGTCLEDIELLRKNPAWRQYFFPYHDTPPSKKFFAPGVT
jgi:hypothetical protein